MLFQACVAANVDDKLKHVGHLVSCYFKLAWAANVDDKLKHVGHLVSCFFKLVWLRMLTTS